MIPQIIVSYLHKHGKNRRKLTVMQHEEIRVLADGLGELNSITSDEASVDIESMLWSWDHVALSSYSALRDMEEKIKRFLETNKLVERER